MVCCEAVRSAILAIDWLLVFTVIKRSQSVYDDSKNLAKSTKKHVVRQMRPFELKMPFLKIPPLRELTTLHEPPNRLAGGRPCTPTHSNASKSRRFCPCTRNIKSAPMISGVTPVRPSVMLLLVLVNSTLWL